MENKDDLQNAVLSAAKNAAEDNLPDYMHDFMQIGGDSDIAYLSIEESGDLYQELVTHSIAYMMMSRLGLDTSEVYSTDSFAAVSHFNTPETLNALGIATSDIAEMALGEIAVPSLRSTGKIA